MDRMKRPGFFMSAGRILIAGAIVVGPLAERVMGQPTPPPGVAYSAGFVPGSRTIFDLNLAAEVIGEFPKSVKLLKGNMELVLKSGSRMLKANSATEFLINLPEFLPQDFTVELSLVPKAGGGPPPDVSIEGTRTINQDVASAHLLWQAQGYLAVIGGAQDNYETPMPEQLTTTLPGVLTQVNVSFEGSSVKLYTNGRRLYTLDRKFARGRVLRVSLGGTDAADGVVYLAGLRIASNSPPVTGFSNAPAGFVAGSRVLYDLNAPPPPPPPPGQPPPPQPGIRVIKGAWTRVQKDGVRMFKASKHTELLVSLLEPLPQDFTVEVELVPKESGPPPDLTLEGTAAIDQGPGSAHLLWQADGYLGIIGGAQDNYESPMPEDFKVTMPGAPTRVALSVEGKTVKLYTNGRRLYTLSGRAFARGKILRVTLGAENDTELAVYLAGLRIATNAPPP
ncbi:MAG TPA: hypothetical protein VLB00_13330 [Gemmatimonadales bacterium]|nr:hypothetical protein [Gemmatimonadales bacterium]